MVILPKKERERRERLTIIRRQQEENRAKVLAQNQNLPYINLIITPIEIDALATVPEGKARVGLFTPFRRIGQRIAVAAFNPKNDLFLKTVEELKNRGFEVEVFICSKTSLLRAIAEYKKVPLPRRIIVGKIEISSRNLEEIYREIKILSDIKKKLKEGEGKEATWILEVLFGSALKLNTSDIHIEPQEKEVKIRYRLDGILHDIFSFKISVYNGLLIRIKLLSGLKLNIHDIAQDGRFTISTPKREMEVRVSVVPGDFGEDIVMRILNPEMLLSIEELGLHPWHQRVLFYEIKKPNGMILTCGPTGSGKTTTLYAFLRYIARPEIKVITIENPIEYRLEGIEQTQTETEKGYDFANALRAVLRQDPDVVLVGEVRDRETAETAIQAALTGHIVFSTLHTNDAAGIVPRLIEMGAAPTAIAPAINLAIAQRLLRRVCKKCAKEYKPSKKTKVQIEKNLQNLPEKIRPNLVKLTLLKAQGCSLCYESGYKGRIGIYEMFQVTPKIEEAILSFPSITMMRKLAIREGMITMQQDGLLRVIEKITTLEELQRITGPME